MQNQEKALQLLKLPQDVINFDGQVQKVSKYQLVEKRVTDRRVLTRTPTGLKPKVTSTYESIAKTTDFGSYVFNLLCNYIHAFNYDVVGQIGGVYRIQKDGIEITVTVGPFAGQTYWIGWSEADIKPSASGFDMEVVSEPWANTDAKGMPEPTHGANPKMSITRVDTIITYADQIKKTGEKVTTVVSFPSYTQSELQALTGWDEYQIADAVKQVFHITTTDSNQYINSFASEITISQDADEEYLYTGTVFYNGLKSSEIPYRTLKSSYGKLMPDHVWDWILINGGVMGDTKRTWQMRYGSADVNTIKVVQTSSPAHFDSATNTLYWNDQEEQAYLIGRAQSLPAQEKNEAAGIQIDLHSGMQTFF